MRDASVSFGRTSRRRFFTCESLVVPTQNTTEELALLGHSLENKLGLSSDLYP